MKKNILTILCDDLGYGDLSCMGASDIQTPYLDALARDSVRFDSLYCASPVCSPSRAALLTGRYPARAGVRAILAGHRKATGLMPSVPTLSRVLSDAGYSTACIGKWHLGVAEPCRPLRHGFDSFYGFLSGCVDYYSHTFYHGIVNKNMNPVHDLWENDTEVYDNGHYLTDVIADRSVEAIRKARQDDRPFFLYTAFNAPHYPMHAPNEYMDRFSYLPRDRQLMAAMVSALDDGVGRIIAELKRSGQYENTLIYFQSDNGPSRESRNWTDGRLDPYYGGSAGGFRGYKYSLFEGGIRIPAMLRIPGVTTPGTVCSEAASAIDLLPTACGYAGVAAPGNIDGCDLMPYFRGEAAFPQRDLFWEMELQTAIRRGQYKLILNPAEDEDRKTVCDVFLADLSADPSEQHNLADEQPALALSMRTAAESWRRGVEAQWEREFAGNYRQTT